MQNCRCGSSPSCHEVKKPGPNRGKWYWKCPTGTCRYFKWDDSALPFIQHPREAYEAAAPLSNIIRRPLSLPFGYLRNKSQGLSRTTVKIVFNLVSPTRIGIRVQKNMTIEPIIASIKDIVWDEQLDQWTIPATLSNYKEAMQALPTGFPNILLEIDGIPDTILQSLFSPEQPIDDPNEMTEVESRYLDFVESPMHRQINQFQRDAVRKGIERHGRILYGNENGLGTSKQTLALASVYQDEWPVLLACPSVLCDTWKEHVQEFFGLDDGQVCVLDYASRGLFKTKSAVHSNKRRKVVRVKSEPVSETISSFRSTPSPSKPNARFRKSYKQKMKERIENDYFSDSDSEAEEPEEMGVEYEPRKNVKFYIASHKKISNNKSKIYEQHFKVMICDGSNYLKFKDVSKCSP
ncbi:hypothetical protein CU098_004134 [Rhizopus stolonifer]|uniref:GRF-type domain-containing protein n=1 Tax=Rhizopus stolonifer TaxID=4846 RepID=A0A367IMN8_RHIST|nr:hypothetical protein CU098_004134 [Rhizopus stolonifer]